MPPHVVWMRSLDLPLRSDTADSDDFGCSVPSEWRTQTAARVTVQFHRLMIKCIWKLLSEILVDPNSNGDTVAVSQSDAFDLFLKHDARDVMVREVMHLSVVQFECALNVLEWVCSNTYSAAKQCATKKMPMEPTVDGLLQHLGACFVSLCDEYQLEGNEFTVDIFKATLTTEEDAETTGFYVLCLTV